MRQKKVALLFVCLLIAGFSSSAWAARTIKIDVTKGPYGTTITVTGSGFNSKNHVTIKYGDASSVSNVAVDNKGNISQTITADGDTAGNYSIQAFEKDSNEFETGKSNALTFTQTTGKKSTHALVILDYPNGMVLTSVDLKGNRRSSVVSTDTCLGENSQCFGAAATPFPLGNGNVVVSTGMSYQDDLDKYVAQEYGFQFDVNFEQQYAFDGPTIKGAVAHPNCWYLSGDEDDVWLTHTKGSFEANLQLVGTAFHPENASAGATKKYLPKVTGEKFVACFGRRYVHAALVDEGVDNYQVEYKAEDKVIRHLTLPVFVPGAYVISADMSFAYQLGHSNREVLIVRTALPQGSDYVTQVFTLSVDVSQPQWEVAGEPIAITKPVLDPLYRARVFHSVAMDPFGRFALYTSLSHSSGVVKSQRLDPGSGEKIGRAHTVVRSSKFHGVAGPYGLGLSFLF